MGWYNRYSPENFYFHPVEDATVSAKAAVSIILKKIQPKSVLDLGCNKGVWLREFKRHTQCEVLGVDGQNMVPHLVIAPWEFKIGDITKITDLGRKFDLALCLETIEHVDKSQEDHVLKLLTDHADHIVFSGAQPRQGGWRHINERKPEYWKLKFRLLGYEIEELELLGVVVYYRMNTFYCRRAET